jgi:hypothetical protein
MAVNTNKRLHPSLNKNGSFHRSRSCTTSFKHPMDSWSDDCCGLNSTAFNPGIQTTGLRPMRVIVLMTLNFGLMVTTASADVDVGNGEKVFKRCAACHVIADTTNKVGPHLVGVTGRKVAGVEGYAYSTGMKEYAAT